MRRAILAGLLATSLGLSGNVLAQRGTAEATIGGKAITIEYGRPSLQGRDMLARLPVGQTWRMGMNAATTLNTAAALKFGDKVIAPGKYELTAKRVNDSGFHLVLSKDGQTTEVPLANKPSTESVETFTINLETKGGNNGSFSMAWGSMHCGADFAVQ